MHVIISSNSVPKPNLIEQLDWIYEAKFDGVELSCSPHPQGAEGLWQWDRKFDRPNVHALRNALCGFKVHTVSANAFDYYNPVFCGLHPLCREIAIDDAIFAMDLAKEMRAGIVTIRTGWLCYGRTAAEWRATLADALGRLNRLAKAKDVMIGIENADYFAALGRFRLLDELALENMGVALDVGRVASGDAGIPVFSDDSADAEPQPAVEEFIGEFRPRILQVYVHDAKDGTDHLPIGRGEVDFKGIIQALRNAGYDRALCLKLRADQVSLDEILESKEHLCELVA
ncbi:MAG: sugar phosphate isomerase/epimerase [Planctomycetes bacterium]|nr:sugar phosphate isomerase/epimerase [Planctomycetota bacterium]